MICWWKFFIGLLGTAGMVIDIASGMASNIGYWFVGAAFLLMFIASFFKKK